MSCCVLLGGEKLLGWLHLRSARRRLSSISCKTVFCVAGSSVLSLSIMSVSSERCETCLGPIREKHVSSKKPLGSWDSSLVNSSSRDSPSFLCLSIALSESSLFSNGFSSSNVSTEATPLADAYRGQDQRIPGMSGQGVSCRQHQPIKEKRKQQVRSNIGHGMIVGTLKD